MNAVVFACLFGALTFVERPFDDVEIGQPNPVTGTAEANFRHADLNGDGAVDVLTPSVVYFQTKSDRTVAVPLPATIGTARRICDIWGADVYFLTPSRLSIVEWDGGLWRESFTQAIDWSVNFTSVRLPPSSMLSAPGTLFERFLHDINGDDVPEIVLPSEEGPTIFARKGELFVPAGAINSFPRLRIATTQREGLWPAEQRHLSFPSRRMSCTYFLDGGFLSVVSEESFSNAEVRYRIGRVRILSTPDGFVADSKNEIVAETPGMPASVGPCRLNGDETIDFAGGDWEYSKSTATPTDLGFRPLFDSVASTDGGKRFQHVRSVSFRPRCQFVDFDGDGDLDLISESMPVLERGAKEAVAQMFTSTKLDHRIEIRLQDASGEFAETPAVMGVFTVQFERMPIPRNAMFNNYLAGQLVDVTGDFDGDGLKDLTVQGASTNLSVYLAEGDGTKEAPHYRFAPDAALHLPLVPGESFAIADVDGDGLSDVQLSRAADSGETSHVVRRTFLTRRTAAP